MSSSYPTSTLSSRYVSYAEEGRPVPRFGEEMREEFALDFASGRAFCNQVKKVGKQARKTLEGKNVLFLGRASGTANFLVKRFLSMLKFDARCCCRLSSWSCYSSSFFSCRAPTASVPKRCSSSGEELFSKLRLFVRGLRDVDNRNPPLFTPFLLKGENEKRTREKHNFKKSCCLSASP